MNPGRESSYANILLKTAEIIDYEELCSLDILGLLDTHHLNKPDDKVFEKVKSQFNQDENRFHGIGLIWKEGRSKLENSKAGSLGRTAMLGVLAG